MGCIEIRQNQQGYRDNQEINSNMGCIEIITNDGKWTDDKEINSNMGCIEIALWLLCRIVC